MKRFITFGSIGQFKQTIKDVQHAARYQSWDEENNKPIYDSTAALPTVEVTASEKIHGTNAAVCFNNHTGFWVQSRKNIITPEKDNAACAFEATQNKEEWINIIKVLASDWNINLNTHIISVFYEWSGGNIQKLSAVSGLGKRAIIFQYFKVSPIEPQIENDGAENPESARWLETKYATDLEESYETGDSYYEWAGHTPSNIYNIMKFPTWTFNVDFENPLLSQNEFIKLVEETIEPNSPIGQAMGINDNVGEGAVFTFTFKEIVYRFKVKGEKHSVSKVKTLTPVDNVKEQLKIDIATKVTPAWRLEQMFAEVFDTLNGGTGDIRRTGDFLKAVNKDILKEESDTISEAGLEPKEVFGKVAQISKKWLFDQIN